MIILVKEFTLKYIIFDMHIYIYIEREQLYTVGELSSEWKLNLWPDGTVCWSDCMEFSGCGFKSHLSQFSMATSESPFELIFLKYLCIVKMKILKVHSDTHTHTHTHRYFIYIYI